MTNFYVFIASLILLVSGVSAGQCSATSLCTDNTKPCCSKYFYCGATSDYCAAGSCISGPCQTVTYPTFNTSLPLNANNKVFIGYLPTWASGRSGSCQMTPEYIDATRYTHIFVAFASFAAPTFKLDAGGSDTNGYYQRVINLKQRNPNLKILISVGGGDVSSETVWRPMVQSAANRAAFVSGCISFAHDNHFDGIDIDWEGHPDTENATETVTLFADLRAAIDADAKSFGSKLLLTSALQPGKQFGAKWIAQSVNQYMDFGMLMAYDFAGTWSTQTQALTPFNPQQTAAYDIYQTMQYYTSLGVQNSKLAIGFANYGVTFTLLDGKCVMGSTQINTSDNAAPKGTCGGGSGIYSYADIVALQNTAGSQVNFDQASQTPFLCNGNIFVTYDNPASLKIKLAYISSAGYLGSMVWTTDRDTTVTDYISVATLGAATATTTPTSSYNSNNLNPAGTTNNFGQISQPSLLVLMIMLGVAVYF